MRTLFCGASAEIFPASASDDNGKWRAPNDTAGHRWTRCKIRVGLHLVLRESISLCEINWVFCS